MAGPVPAAAEARIDAAVANAVANEASAAEADAAIENRQVAAAVARVEAAEQTAEDIALAALQTELGRQVEALSQRLSIWQNEHDTTHQTLNSELASLKTEIASCLEKMNSTAPSIAIAVTEPSSSLPASPATAAAVINPAESAAPMPAESVAPAVPPKRRIKLI